MISMFNPNFNMATGLVGGPSRLNSQTLRDYRGSKEETSGRMACLVPKNTGLAFRRAVFMSSVKPKVIADLFEVRYYAAYLRNYLTPVFEPKLRCPNPNRVVFLSDTNQVVSGEVYHHNVCIKWA